MILKWRRPAEWQGRTRQGTAGGEGGRGGRRGGGHGEEADGSDSRYEDEAWGMERDEARGGWVGGGGHEQGRGGGVACSQALQLWGRGARKAARGEGQDCETKGRGRGGGAAMHFSPFYQPLVVLSLHLRLAYYPNAAFQPTMPAFTDRTHTT